MGITESVTIANCHRKRCHCKRLHVQQIITILQTEALPIHVALLPKLSALKCVANQISNHNQTRQIITSPDDAVEEGGEMGDDEAGRGIYGHVQSQPHHLAPLALPSVDLG